MAQVLIACSRHMPKKKKKIRFTPATVGAYFLRYDENLEAWVTLIHRRCRKLSYGGMLATPGGNVDSKDASFTLLLEKVL